MPKRYMVDLHHVVARDKYIANTHVATAGGAVASIVLAILVHGFGLHNRVLGYALLLMTAVMFVGAVFVYRRRLNPPARLSKGPWMRLPKSLMAFSASFFCGHAAGGGDSSRAFWRLGAGHHSRAGRVVGRERAVFRHDMGRANEACLCWRPALGVAPTCRAFWRRSLDWFETVGSERPQRATRCGKTQGLHLEPATGFRRLCAMRQM